MLPHQERVITEKNELDAKIKALIGFFDTVTFQSLHATDQYLLSEQYQHMKEYSITLDLRIKRFTQ